MIFFFAVIIRYSPPHPITYQPAIQPFLQNYNSIHISEMNMFLKTHIFVLADICLT